MAPWARKRQCLRALTMTLITAAPPSADGSGGATLGHGRAGAPGPHRTAFHFQPPLPDGKHVPFRMLAAPAHMAAPTSPKPRACT